MDEQQTQRVSCCALSSSAQCFFAASASIVVLTELPDGQDPYCMNKVAQNVSFRGSCMQQWDGRSTYQHVSPFLLTSIPAKHHSSPMAPRGLGPQVLLLSPGVSPLCIVSTQSQLGLPGFIFPPAIASATPHPSDIITERCVSAWISLPSSRPQRSAEDERVDRGARTSS